MRQNELKDIVDIAITKLTPHPKNPNKHPKDQIARLAEILKYQGFRQPIVVSKRSGYVVAGHGRIEAAKKNKWATVPVVYQDFDDDAQEYAHLTADNAIATWAELQIEDIKLEAIQFQDLNPDMLGIKNLSLGEDKYEDKDADAVPDVAQNEMGVEIGDIYQLGEHRLMCGDSTDLATVEKLMNGEKADMVFTDPPYGMNVVKPDGNIGGNRVGKNGYGEKGQYGKEAKCGIYKPIIGDDKPYDPTHLMNMAELKIIWGANHFSDKLPCSPHWIVWNKEMPEGTDFSGAELAWTNIDKKAVKVFKFTWAGMTRQGDRKDELTKRVHPTQKPVSLFVDILNHYDPKSVIDVFMGSGSTLIACEKTSRKCYGMELDPHYCSVIIKRWEEFTNQKAQKLNG